MIKWKSAVKKMNSLSWRYNDARKTETKSVHQTLLLRSLIVLKAFRPETEPFYTPMLRTMIQYTKRPDKKGDYENGFGYHYYCASAPDGKRLEPVNGYYKNGAGKLSRSARTMLEEDYTMALTMHHAGFYDKCAEYLGRAVHMLSDICCLPHTTKMTYFSDTKNVHKAYEKLAETIYPEFIPGQTADILPDIFTLRSGFERPVNKIAENNAKEIQFLVDDPFRSISEKLLYTERIIAAFLLRFYEDSFMKEKDAHFISTQSKCRIFPGSDSLSVQVTKKGIIFHGVNPSPESKINVTLQAFRAAHRHDGLFTLSPSGDKNGIVLEVSGNRIRLAKFNPVHSEQLFRI